MSLDSLVLGQHVPGQFVPMDNMTLDSLSLRQHLPGQFFTAFSFFIPNHFVPRFFGRKYPHELFQGLL